MTESKKLILAMDPGSTSFGVAVIDPSKMAILAHGLNQNTVTMMMPGVSQQVRDFKTFLTILQSKGCEYAVAERYQTRGIKGLSSELIAVMLGITLTVFPDKTRLLIASQWKNAYGRAGVDLDDLYLRLRPITPHQIDASLMGLWMACKLRKIPLLPVATLIKLLQEADQPSPEQLKIYRKSKVRPSSGKKKKRKAKV